MLVVVTGTPRTISHRSPGSPARAHRVTLVTCARVAPRVGGHGDRRRRPTGRAGGVVEPGGDRAGRRRRRPRRAAADRSPHERRGARRPRRVARAREHRRRARLRPGVRRRRLRRARSSSPRSCRTSVGWLGRVRNWPPARTALAGGGRHRPRRSCGSRGRDDVRSASPPPPPSPARRTCSTTAGACSAPASPRCHRPPASCSSARSLSGSWRRGRHDRAPSRHHDRRARAHAGPVRPDRHARHRPPAGAHDDRVRRRRAGGAHRSRTRRGSRPRRTWFTGRRLASDASVVRSAAASVGGAALLVGLVHHPPRPRGRQRSGRCATATPPAMPPGSATTRA